MGITLKHRVRRRRRGQPRASFNGWSSLRDSLKSEALTPAFLFLLTLAPALALGAVQLGTLAVIAAVAFLLVPALLWAAPTARLPATLCLAVCGYCLLQALPLPLGFIEALAPANADVWRESLLLADARAPETGHFSLDPGASLREALKWAFYGAAMALSSVVARRHGLRPVLWIVFASATTVALVTLAHGVVGAEKVYGFYERSFNDSQWALSPLINGNNLAGYLNLGFFTGLALALESKTAELRLSIAVGMLLLGALSLTSGSRGAVGTLLLGLLLVGVVLLARFRGKGSKGQALSVALPVAAALLATLAVLWLIPGAVTQSLGDKNIDKLHMIQWVLPLLKDSPLFGVGAGAFETGFLPYRVKEDGVIWTHPENLFLGWLTEFGLPVTLLLLAGFCWLAWKSRRRRPSASHVVAWMAVLIWFVHNLVDLAVMVPGVFVAVLVLLGALLEPSRRRLPSPEAKVTPVFPVALGVIGLAVTMLALRYGAPDANADRRAVHARLEQRNLPDSDTSADFFSHLRPAIHRHPGDGYLFRAGALVKLRENDPSALRWIGRALERDLMNAQTHLLLARVLGERGAISQGLLELRLAVERSPHLAPTAAAMAYSWTQDRGRLERSVPAGKAGVPMLVQLARLLPQESSDGTREQFLRSALDRDPDNVEARLALVQELLRLLTHDAVRCQSRQPSCSASLKKHFESLDRARGVEPRTANRILLAEAEFFALTGDAERAVKSLLEDCPRSETSCLRAAVSLSAKYKLPLDEPAQFYLAVSCPGEDDCLDARRFIGAAFARAKLFGSALSHYKDAAAQSGQASDYLLAARTALDAGTYAEVGRLLARVKRATPRPTEKELKQVSALEQSLAKTSRESLRRPAHP